MDGEEPDGPASAAASVFERARAVRTLVVGDVMLDRFVRGGVRRISPEAPVPIVEVAELSEHPGGAANVARNLAEFSGHVAILGRVGRDGSGETLARLLDRHGVGTQFLVRSETAVTATKTRVVAGHQQVVRYDEERNDALTAAEERAVLDALEAAAAECDCIVVEDYGKGLLTPNLVDRLRDLAAKGMLVTVDPNPGHAADWSGFTAVKPNLAEACAATGVEVRITERSDPLSQESLRELIRRLMERWAPEYLLLTAGEHGMVFAERASGRTTHIPARAREVFDVSGAGDTAIALFSLVLAASGTGEEAAFWANEAASLVVGKLGTATVTADELQNSTNRKR